MFLLKLCILWKHFLQNNFALRITFLTLHIMPRFIALFLSLFLVACTRAFSQAPVSEPVLESTVTLFPSETAPPLSTPTPTPILPLPFSPTPKPSPTGSQLPPSTETPVPDTPPVITLVFTGQIVPARCVQAAVDVKGNADYIYAGVLDYLQAADLTIGTLNATLSDVAPRTGCVETFILVGSPNNADAMAQAGFDVMSVATNHIKNCGLTSCGDQAFLETMDNLRRVGILPVGAGMNHAEAMLPVVVDVKGVRFGFVSLGQIEPNAFAGEDSPGIAILNEDNLREAIRTAQTLSDVVIVIPHWGPEYSHNPNPSQQSLAQVAVDAGADLVVGNHTHYFQAFGDVSGVPVFYGLGNFVFDQTQERERQQSLILRVYFHGTEYIGFEIFPTITEKDGTLNLADPEETSEILLKLQGINEGLP
jgi:poly-gamma-glutamate capsule biosynthesis protein CapA/YwtB (metallophosphatase superfamily)